ncbi:MAG: DUF3237 family protein [Pseudomonadota bacterium]
MNHSFVPPRLEFFASAEIQVGPPLEFGPVGGGVRRMIPIIGGTVSAQDWKGIVLPGGMDYQFVVDGRRAHLEARYTIETDAGDLIYVCNRAVRAGPPEALSRLQRGDPVAPGEVYSCGSPTFETSSASLGWIADRIFIASGRRRPDRVELGFYVVG